MRPRLVRLTTRGYLYTAGMVLLTAFVLWLLSFWPARNCLSHQARTEPRVRSLFLYGASHFGRVTSPFSWSIREKHLFTNGEVSGGVVLTQSEARIGSRIVYSYSDARGSSFQNRATDFSNKLYRRNVYPRLFTTRLTLVRAQRLKVPFIA